MDVKTKSRVAVVAAGGIVLRRDPDATALFAVVQSARKFDTSGAPTWGLPKGKLAGGEDAVTAARREVVEETGHFVTVHEFLGTLVYETANRPKVVQFWRMEAGDSAHHAPSRDVQAVDWLSLDDALERLSHLRERAFLEQVGPTALRLCRTAARSARMPPQFAAFAAAHCDAMPPDPDPDPGPGHGIAALRGLHTMPAAAVPEDGEDAADAVPARCYPHNTAAAGAAATPAPPGSGARGKDLLAETWGWRRYVALSQRSVMRLISKH